MTKRVAVVGGGTAGWLAALMLRRAWPGAAVAVIESPTIPTVGVGEGSTSIFRQVLLDIGIDEDDFLRETGATLKFGIRHCGWRPDGRDYWGPIDDPGALSPAPEGLPSNWPHHVQVAAGKSAADAHLFTQLMRRRKGAHGRRDGRRVVVSPYHHAYHFDQARLGRYLAGRARDIDHIRADVADVRRDAETGDVAALTSADGRSIPVDLVIDCTGFRRAVIGKLGAAWHSYGAMLPLDRAMPFWLDHDPSRDIASYTTARALGSGWMWAIPVQDRIGCGYVFSAAHLTPETAQAEVEARLGHPIEPRRVIPIDPGRLKTAWRHNVVALGLAQSFLEPLEATSIHGTLVQAMLLLRADPLRGPRGRDAYNATVARQVDDFATFINLHYAGGRTDTPFWCAMTHDGIAAANRDRIARWQAEPMTGADFAPLPGRLPHVEEQLHMPVLDGLGLTRPGPSKRALAAPGTRAAARKSLAALRAEFAAAAQAAEGHRAALGLLEPT